MRYTMEPITVNYKVLDPRAKVPAYATPGAAAADLCAVLDEPLTLAPMQRALVPTCAWQTAWAWWTVTTAGN